jgi:phosphatidylserine decarboxylase
MFYILFGKVLSFITFLIARTYIPYPFRAFAFRRFAASFGLNLDEVKAPLTSFKSFDAFFTRELKPEARPISDQAFTLVSPVDAHVLEFGHIHQGQLIQAKGVAYSLQDFLGNFRTEDYEKGSFITLYLSPADCHRIFSPIAGNIRAWHHIPGYLYPVREPHISKTKDLYVENERLFSLIESQNTNVLVGKVGATNVGTMSLSYDTLKTNRWFQKEHTKYFDIPKQVVPGEHISTFHLGSTVVLITDKRVRFTCSKKQSVRYGQPIGTLEP